MSKELAITKPREMTGSAFSSLSNFDAAQRMAKCLVSSELVPVSYQTEKNIGNALIALELAQRIGASPLMVMQNIDIIYGRPSWRATFVIAAINTSGKFTPIRYRVTGEGDEKTCVAWAKDLHGEVLESPPVSIAMAKREGWYERKGSKWQTMSDLMLRYRAATFFGRLYAPELLMGMQTSDEVEDIGKEAINVQTISVETLL